MEAGCPHPAVREKGRSGHPHSIGQSSAAPIPLKIQSPISDPCYGDRPQCLSNATQGDGKLQSLPPLLPPPSNFTRPVPCPPCRENARKCSAIGLRQVLPTHRLLAVSLRAAVSNRPRSTPPTAAPSLPYPQIAAFHSTASFPPRCPDRAPIRRAHRCP